MSIQEVETPEEQEVTVQEALQRAEALRKKKAYKEGIDILVEALRYGINREMIYYRLGNLYIDGGDLSRAEYAYKRAIEVDPHHANAMHNLAIVYKRQGKTSLYVKTYKESQRMVHLQPRQSARLPVEEKRKRRHLGLKVLLWGLAAGGILVLILFLLGYW
ncbi:MAG: Photosystem I assembly protein Ycf3 [Chloroflexi bacterium]|nr:Photosystem I assembly protein Ycf3 [Chloroflexota bacterium]